MAVAAAHHFDPPPDDADASRDSVRESPWLRWGIAFVWLATAVSVLHPSYREIGQGYLDRIHMPEWLMWVTCAFELILGLRVGLGPAKTWITVLQASMIVCFTAILAVSDPMLLAHPFGVLSKNLPMLAVIGVAWLIEREGWTPRALWLLRVGMAVIWITEGLLPKVFFQQEFELEVVRNSGLVPFDAGVFLMGMGIAQALSGVAVLVLRGPLLRFVLACQFAALLALPLVVSAQDLTLWVHPFGPMTKNIPILVGTFVVLIRLRRKARGQGL